MKYLTVRNTIFTVRKKIFSLSFPNVKNEIFFCQVDDWMAQVDTNNDGRLSYEEFKKSLDGKITVTE